MKFRISIAGQLIEIHSLCRMVYVISKDYLVADDGYAEPITTVDVSDDDILSELHIMQQEKEEMQRMNSIIVGESYLESLAVFRKIAGIMPYYDTFLMHGAVVAYDGYAYMFSAPSGVGKSTRASIWLKQYPGSFIVNGDKPLIKVTNEEVLACGTPWCGKEGWNTNAMVPLRAIFLLERTKKGEQDLIEELRVNEAFPQLIGQTHRPEDTKAIMRTLHLLNAMGKRVKIYRFRSSPTSESIQLAYNMAKP